MKTETLCLMPILGCLDESLSFLYGKEDKQWQTFTDKQKEFIYKFWRFREKLQRVKELKSKANRDVSVINRWLKEEGFDIQLEKRDGDRISVASILKLIEEWQKIGKKLNITSQNTHKTYPGVFLKEGGIEISEESKIHPYPVIRIFTKNGDQVCMSMVDEVSKGSFGLYESIIKLSGVNSPSRFTQVHFPMIDLDVKPDISWICGMETSDGDYLLDQALQQTKFQMNEKGAKVESGVAMQLFKCAIRVSPVHEINKPFALWINRRGCGVPLFMAILCEDVWKEPK